MFQTLFSYSFIKTTASEYLLPIDQPRRGSQKLFVHLFIKYALTAYYWVAQRFWETESEKQKYTNG